MNREQSLEGAEDVDGASVLVLDSDRTFRETLVNQLLIAGFASVEAVSSEEEFLRRLLLRDFDAVLVEIRPRASALGLARQIRAVRGTTQVVFMLDDRQGDRLLRFPAVLKSSLPRSLFGLLGREEGGG
jgi:CheY-like chemotaxis protein